MSSHFVEIPADVLKSFLKSKGFIDGEEYSEVVFTRSHDVDRRIKVKVWTSIGVGRRKARAKDADAIRVCLVKDTERGTIGLAKFPKVLRVNSIDGTLSRVLEHMRAAYQRGTEIIRAKV